MEVTEEACEEENRCEKDSESHLAAKRARVCATFTDSHETVIVEFVKEHPALYDKEHACFHDRQKKEALWAEISAELKLQPCQKMVRIPENVLWQAVQTTIWPSPKGDDQETVLGLPADGFLKIHIRRKGASRSSGFEAKTPASRMNLVDLLLIQNTLSPVS